MLACFDKEPRQAATAEGLETWPDWPVRHRVRSVSIRVMPADSGKLAEKAQDLVQWILDQALDGIGPLPSASDLADDYKSQPYANDAERVQALIRWAVAKKLAS